MKVVTMFVIDSCPHCKRALQWMGELKKENIRYDQVEIKIIDENLQPDLARQFNYYYVPTYFVEEKKVHEGVASKEIVARVFEEALES